MIFQKMKWKHSILASKKYCFYKYAYLNFLLKMWYKSCVCFVVYAMITAFVNIGNKSYEFILRILLPKWSPATFLNFWCMCLIASKHLVFWSKEDFHEFFASWIRWVNFKWTRIKIRRVGHLNHTYDILSIYVVF